MCYIDFKTHSKERLNRHKEYDSFIFQERQNLSVIYGNRQRDHDKEMAIMEQRRRDDELIRLKLGQIDTRIHRGEARYKQRLDLINKKLDHTKSVHQLISTGHSRKLSQSFMECLQKTINREIKVKKQLQSLSQERFELQEYLHQKNQAKNQKHLDYLNRQKNH